MEEVKTPWGRAAMKFAFMISLILVILAVLGVFIFIPLVSNNAFWFVIAAWFVLVGSK
jgi:hypothetical protein